jgi:hypothetical protein
MSPEVELYRIPLVSALLRRGERRGLFETPLRFITGANKPLLGELESATGAEPFSVSATGGPWASEEGPEDKADADADADGAKTEDAASSVVLGLLLAVVEAAVVVVEVAVTVVNASCGMLGSVPPPASRRGTWEFAAVSHTDTGTNTSGFAVAFLSKTVAADAGAAPPAFLSVEL